MKLQWSRKYIGSRQSIKLQWSRQNIKLQWSRQSIKIQWETTIHKITMESTILYCITYHQDPDCYKSCINLKTGPTLKCRNALAFDFISLTELYFYS